ncbi:MAG: RimK/LysX family protein [Pseudomonadota bacterium]
MLLIKIGCISSVLALVCLSNISQAEQDNIKSDSNLDSPLTKESITAPKMENIIVNEKSTSNTVEVKVNHHSIMGWLETVYLADIPHRLIGKLDSGAKTSSIHGEIVDHFKRDDSDWVRVKFAWEQSTPKKKLIGPYYINAPIVRKTRIKNHFQISKTRPVVRLPLAIAGKCYDVEFTVADRTRFNYPILLGRRFLKKIAIVDSSKTFTTSELDLNDYNACKNHAESQPDTKFELEDASGEAFTEADEIKYEIEMNEINNPSDGKSSDTPPIPPSSKPILNTSEPNLIDLKSTDNISKPNAIDSNKEKNRE